MARNYTQYETDTLDWQIKRQLAEFITAYGGAPIILHAINNWTDRIEKIPKARRNSVKLKDWAAKIAQAATELDAAIDSEDIAPTAL